MEKENWGNIPLEEVDQKIAIEKFLAIKKLNQERNASEFIAFKEKIAWELSDIICIVVKANFKRNIKLYKIGYIENGEVYTSDA